MNGDACKAVGGYPCSYCSLSLAIAAPLAWPVLRFDREEITGG